MAHTKTEALGVVLAAGERDTPTYMSCVVGREARLAGIRQCTGQLAAYRQHV